ncbi:helix-turn-helix transcriptional regulator [Curtobacterium sp. 9128]|uniref:helix-turn-helix transcriptional regulator n=1 Tax=Curtobacterium sp. 9128 TaxID=1793722 RepID=UPI0011A46AD0|nr:helix-turn-helix transcriptional regulator [Curtobacterium sp. 9128]
MGTHRELGAFLRSRRDRLTPQDVGLPTGGRRRTPGLRREEVALLAGVGVTWYTWLEQGRDIRPSAQVLRAVGRVLRLDDDEQAYLSILGGVEPVGAAPAARRVDDGVIRLLDQLAPDPAYVQDALFNLVAHNAPFARLVTDLDALAPAERNTMWLAFTDPAWRRAMPDWDDVTARMVAQLRSQTGSDRDQRERDDLVARLGAASPRFVELWERQDVLQPRTGHKVYDSPLVGRLRFDVVTTWLQPGRGLRLLVHLPADVETEARLRDALLLTSAARAV